MPAMARRSLAILFLLGTCVQVAWAGTCPDDPEVDLCDEVKEEASAAVKLPKALTLSQPSKPEMTCDDVKTHYKEQACCGFPSKEVEVQIVPNPPRKGYLNSNPCSGKKQLTQPGMNNIDCFRNGVRQAGEQSGADITKGFTGTINSSLIPISVPYYKTTLCPVNVHWHLGAEHRSAGEFDEQGSSPKNHLVPEDENPEDTRRRLGPARYGYACRKYNPVDRQFNTEYAWKYCKDMHVGETYEVHWPHSALGACGTPNQYQDPFYDGVFCGATKALLGSLTPQDIASSVGVQGQVFTIINDDNYYYPDLIRGMIVDRQKDMGIDIAVYTGSTTGTTRNNKVCSAYTPITWQVDRKCHLISASAFDKMCADMLQMRDDMSGDIHPHGSRKLVWKNLTANNQRDIVL